MSTEITSTTPLNIEDCRSRIEHLETLVTELTKAVKSKPKRSRDPVQHSHDELLRYYQKRDEINAKRRAAYKAKKEAIAAVSGSS